MVEMVMRREQQLDVLDAQPFALETLLERRQRALVTSPRVDQGHRIARQQPGVHRADVSKRKGYGNWVVHELTSVLQTRRPCATPRRR
jgi:hypothetical protein